MLTNEKIQELLALPKTICDKQFKPILKGKYYSDTAVVNCESELEGKFEIFVTQHTEFIDNFSIGLLYLKNGKKYNLIRVNGSTTHHKIKHHRTPHAHFLTEDDIENGRESKPSKRENEIMVVSFNEAILYFSRKAMINNYEDYFNNVLEQGLFE
ncbi:MAG: hypothetical protein KKB34_05420 [Bacteroidetes bacterium]|nr:hypothetical protein [Bacteroidota bacterium]